MDHTDHVAICVHTLVERSESITVPVRGYCIIERINIAVIHTMGEIVVLDFLRPVHVRSGSGTHIVCLVEPLDQRRQCSQRLFRRPDGDGRWLFLFRASEKSAAQYRDKGDSEDRTDCLFAFSLHRALPVPAWVVLGGGSIRHFTRTCLYIIYVLLLKSIH